MERRKNKGSLLFVVIFVFLGIMVFGPLSVSAQSIGGPFKPYGGKVQSNYATMCLGGEPSFDVITPTGTVEGPFGITPFTLRYQFFTTWGAPLKNIVLLALNYKIPGTCWKPCDDNCCTPAGVCPVAAYPVHMFGISLTP